MFTQKLTLGVFVVVVAGSCAANAQNGQLQLCKKAGAGVTATSFNFTVNGVNVAVPSNGCTSLAYAPGTLVNIQEAASSGLAVSSITSSGQLQSQDLANRTASLRMTGSTTTVTYTNSLATTLGSLVICKIAGTGVTAGTPFRFTVTGTGVNDTVTVAAGAAPGTCSTALSVPSGNTVLITEAAAEGTSVSTITGGSNANTNARNVSATIAPTGLTVVTFTNIASSNVECGLGYYKNNLDSTLANKRLSDYFTGLPVSMQNETLLEALSAGGGSGVNGALRIMLRAAVVGLLDSMNSSLHYQYTTSQIISMVNSAVVSNNRQTIMAAAAQFDAANGNVGGCSSGGGDDDTDSDGGNGGHGHGQNSNSGRRR